VQVPNAQSVHSPSSQFDKSKLIIKKEFFGNETSDKHSIAKISANVFVNFQYGSNGPSQKYSVQVLKTNDD
jgi:hypothetical protein